VVVHAQSSASVLKIMSQPRNRFLQRNPEKGDLNQYWYSVKTIQAMADDVVEHASAGAAFLSTPSIYFSLPDDVRSRSKVFDVSFLFN
jgi:EEF1A lysine methyltransferase 1